MEACLSQHYSISCLTDAANLLLKNSVRRKVIVPDSHHTFSCWKFELINFDLWLFSVNFSLKKINHKLKMTLIDYNLDLYFFVQRLNFKYLKKCFPEYNFVYSTQLFDTNSQYSLVDQTSTWHKNRRKTKHIKFKLSSSIQIKYLFVIS